MKTENELRDELTFIEAQLRAAKRAKMYTPKGELFRIKIQSLYEMQIDVLKGKIAELNLPKIKDEDVGDA